MKKTINHRRVSRIAGIVLLLLGTGGSAGAMQADLQRQLQGYLDSASENTVGGVSLRHKQTLTEVYEQRQNRPIWVQDGDFTSTGDAILKKLARADREGLSPDEYYVPLIRQWVSNGDPARNWHAELLITDSLLAYFSDVAMGFTAPPSTKSGWHFPPNRIDVAEIAAPFFAGHKTFRQVLDELRPSNSRYHSLLAAHARYSAIRMAGGWSSVKVSSSLRKGDSGAEVMALKQRLIISGDLRPDNKPLDYFDDATSAAVLAFQSRHGLTADGIAGRDTVAQMNIPVDDKLAQIELNLERWRWLPRELGDRHVLVNVAGSELELKVDGETTMEMRTVVGKPEHRTPLFTDKMEYMVFNPAWHVPSSITRKLLKREQRQPGYLDRNKFQAIPHEKYAQLPVSSLPSHELDSASFLSSYRLRQAPGKQNALGKLKFMFPNKFSVYLHDTKDRHLFAESNRAHSHGCVRVEQPDELARALLLADGVSDAEIDSLINSGKTRKMALSSPVPVHLTYQTAWVDRFGQVQFRPDIYRHDHAPKKSMENTRAVHAAVSNSLLNSSAIKLATNSQ